MGVVSSAREKGWAVWLLVHNIKTILEGLFNELN